MSAGRPHDDPEWHQFRSGGITATDVAKAVSGRYGGAYAVVANKLGLLPPTPTTERMERGHTWQPIVADATVVTRGLHVVGEETWCQHVDRPTHRATVDGFLAHTDHASAEDLVAVWECKTRGADTSAAWDYWAPQVQWQLWVTGLPWAMLAEAVIDDPTGELVSLRFHRIEANEWEQQHLATIADDLWRRVADGELPDPDGPALETVKAVHAVAAEDATTVDMTEATDALARYVELGKASSAIDAERDAIQAMCRHMLGGATHGTTEDGWTVTVAKPRKQLDEAAALADHPAYVRTSFDRARFESDHGTKALDPYKTPTGTRTFTVKPPKETTP